MLHLWYVYRWHQLIFKKVFFKDLHLQLGNILFANIFPGVKAKGIIRAKNEDTGTELQITLSAGLHLISDYD